MAGAVGVEAARQHERLLTAVEQRDPDHAEVGQEGGLGATRPQP